MWPEVRVHELVKELGVESKVVLDKLKAKGVFVKSASSNGRTRGAGAGRDGAVGAGAVPLQRVEDGLGAHSDHADRRLGQIGFAGDS